MTFFSSLKNRFKKQQASLEEDIPPAIPVSLLQEDSVESLEENFFSEIPPPLPSKTDSLLSADLLNKDLLKEDLPPLPLSPKESQNASSLKDRFFLSWKQFQSSYKKIITVNKASSLRALFSKQFSPPSSLKKASSTRDTLLLRPSESSGAWQLWKFPFKKTSEKKELLQEESALLLEELSEPVFPTSTTRLIVGVPTRDLIVIPLWISSEGNQNELIELELASKHLLRRGMAEGLKTIPLETKDNRFLVIVLAPTSASLATAPYLKKADQFEANARFLPQQADLIIWRELGEVCFGFSKNQQFVWFSGSSEPTITSSVVGLIKRMALRLQAESVLENTPRHYSLIGSFSQEERLLLEKINAIEIHAEAMNPLSSLPIPLIPVPSLDLPNEQAREERLRQGKKLRLKKIVTLISFVYLILLMVAGGILLVNKSTLSYFQRQIITEKPAITQANQTLAQWQELRPAIDPTTYTLDILAAMARQIHGEKIRLIMLAGITGRLQVTGEATDVAQAYRFIEQIKKAPELQEYSWSSGQPKLAGKNSVRFELEGSRPNAKTSHE